MDLGNGYGHLTYSMLVHPGDSWSDMKTSLTTYMPEVKKRFSPNAKMGVSFRMANATVQELLSNPDQRQWLKNYCLENDLYIFTVNEIGRAHV